LETPAIGIRRHHCVHCRVRNLRHNAQDDRSQRRISDAVEAGLLAYTGTLRALICGHSSIRRGEAGDSLTARLACTPRIKQYSNWTAPGEPRGSSNICISAGGRVVGCCRPRTISHSASAPINVRICRTLELLWKCAPHCGIVLHHRTWHRPWNVLWLTRSGVKPRRWSTIIPTSTLSLCRASSRYESGPADDQ
jgi:hypothetical protein